MFPFVTVVECPESKMLESIGPTLVCSAVTCNADFRRRLVDEGHEGASFYIADGDHRVVLHRIDATRAGSGRTS